MPLGSGYEDQSCALARALEILGERWTLLIVRDAFHGLTRYDEFLRSLGMATNILSTRLQSWSTTACWNGPRRAVRIT